MTENPSPQAPTATLFLGGPMDGQWMTVERDPFHVRYANDADTLPLFDAATDQVRTTPVVIATYVRRRLVMFGRTLDVYVDDRLDDQAVDDAAWRTLTSTEAKASLLGSSMNRLRARGAL